MRQALLIRGDHYKLKVSAAQWHAKVTTVTMQFVVCAASEYAFLSLGMKARSLQFILAIGLVACAMAAMRFNQFDVPVLRFLRRGRVDPVTLHLQGEFMEANLGSAQERDGSVTVRMIAQQYVFVPRCVLVPAGVPIQFRVTSADVVHLLSISGSHDAMKVVPGRVSEAHFQFETPGDYKMPCREFCGAGHYAMRSEMLVVPREHFRALGPDERVNCASR